MSEITDKIEKLNVENENIDNEISELKSKKFSNMKKIRSLEEAQKTLEE